MNKLQTIHKGSRTKSEKILKKVTFSRGMPSRLLTFRKVLAVLAAAPLPAISGQGCPEKADLRLDGAWRPVACLPVSAAAVLRTAYTCSPVSGLDGIPLPEGHDPVRIFSGSVRLPL